MRYLIFVVIFWCFTWTTRAEEERWPLPLPSPYTHIQRPGGDTSAEASKAARRLADHLLTEVPNARAVIDNQDENNIPVFDPAHDCELFNHVEKCSTASANVFIETAQNAYDITKIYWNDVSVYGRKVCLV